MDNLENQGNISIPHSLLEKIESLRRGKETLADTLERIVMTVAPPSEMITKGEGRWYLRSYKKTGSLSVICNMGTDIAKEAPYINREKVTVILNKYTGDVCIQKY